PCRSGRDDARHCRRARLALAQPRSLSAQGSCARDRHDTPYSLDYDLMLLAPAIAFLVADGMQRGFGHWEKTLLASLLPILTRPGAEATHVPLALSAMMAVFAWLLRRAMAEIGTTIAWRPAARSLD